MNITRSSPHNIGRDLAGHRGVVAPVTPDEEIMLRSIVAWKQEQYAKLHKRCVSEPHKREALRAALPTEMETLHKPRARRILEAVAMWSNITVEQMTTRTQAHHVCKPRMVAMALIRRHTKLSLPSICRVFWPGLHHTTVMYGIAEAEARASREPDLALWMQMVGDELAEPGNATVEL